MADIVNAEKRSEIMALVRAKDTKPEILLRRELHSRGIRYSLHSKMLPGKPDLVLRKHKTVIFVHGCFWHRHKKCSKSSMPSTNVEFWKKKFRRNVERDRTNTQALVEQGWRVIIVWECALMSNLNSISDQVLDLLFNSSSPVSMIP